MPISSNSPGDFGNLSRPRNNAQQIETFFFLIYGYLSKSVAQASRLWVRRPIETVTLP